MAVLGIVAEYDPFHNGHLHHLREACASVSPEAVIVALSGPLKQRGEPAMLSPFRRAECALSAGADAVFSLPVLWTVRDAEHYALGAVSLLSSLGVTHLAFGAETADPVLLQRTADLLENTPAAFCDVLHSCLSKGRGYPVSLSEAAEACLPGSGLLLRQSNNILAVCYLRAIRRLCLSLAPVIIPRAGSYSADRIVPASPSASAVREALYRGAWPDALSSLPPVSGKAVRSAFLSGEVPQPERLDALLLEKLRSLAPEQLSRLPDAAEGLDALLSRAAVSSDSRDELVALLTTRRYTSARISRLCAYALLGVTREQLESLPLPDAALLLAIKKGPSLAGLWKNSPVKILSAVRWLEHAGPAERAAWRIWGLLCGKPGSFPCTQKTGTAM